MSKPKIVVSAISEIPEDYSLKQVWNELEKHLDRVEPEDFGGENEYRFYEGYIGEYKVETNYHSQKGEEVIEVIIQEGEPQELSEGNLIEKFRQIDNKIPYSTELVTYYWYTGADRTGVS